MTDNQINTLHTMMNDMSQQSNLYKPTSFWIEASKIIVEDLKKNEIGDFRNFTSSMSMFAPVYAYHDYLNEKNIFKNTKEALLSVTADIKSNIKLEMLLLGHSQAFADYRVLQASNVDYAPYTNLVSESSVGNPLEQFVFDGRKFSRSFLNYLLGLSFIKQHIDTQGLKTVMEIGGGFGTLGEILLSDERNECFYINADIPPVSFVSSYYLKEVFGSKNIADYSDLKDEDILNIEALKDKYKGLNITSWQIPKLQGSIDLFVNFISFQEMEPEVVQNYCNHISRLKPKYILLRNILEGKKKQSDDSPYGVTEPIVGDDYDTFLPEYKLLATDSSIFGFKTEDNFHSQLRLYARY